MFESFEVPSELIPSDPRFGVGPSLVPPEHLLRLANTGDQLMGTSHRQAAVRNLVKEIQKDISKYFSLPAGYEVVLGNGGATFLFDMIGLGLVEKSSLHFVCGEFSNKWYSAHHKIPWIKAEKREVPVGSGINPVVEAEFDMICCTLNETSTGVMLTQLPSVDEDTLLAVDATSGAGQIKIDFNKIDLYIFSPQKVLASEGGLYLAIMSPKALKRAEKLYKRDSYIPDVMSWKSAIENSRKNQTYNTPAISTLFLLREQLRLMCELGEDKVCAMAQEKLALLTDWVNGKDYLNFYVEDECYRSLTVATINIAEQFNAEKLAKRLRELGVAYDIDAYRKLGKNQFRISLFHNITINDLEKLTKIISLAIESHGGK